MKKWYQYLLIIPFIFLIFYVPLRTAYESREQTSNYCMEENRMLAVMPELSADAVWDGSYFTGVETYFADHVAARESLLRLNIRLQKLRKMPVISDVVLQEDTLLPKVTLQRRDAEPNEANADSMAARLAAICGQVEDYGGTFLYISVPSMYSARADAYPSYAVAPLDSCIRLENALTERLTSQNVPFLTMREFFAAQESLEPYYFTTDHHYTVRGAYATYRALCDALNARGLEVPVVTEEHISFYELPNPFYGTYDRKLYGLSPVQDKLEYYDTDLTVPYERWDNGVQTDAAVQVEPSYSAQRVFYSGFMGGDQAETVIKTNRPELPSILIVGDSYTNPLEAIAYLSFDEMRSLDFRHYTEMTLSEYISIYQPEVVVVLRDDTVAIDLTGNGNLG